MTPDQESNWQIVRDFFTRLLDLLKAKQAPNNQDGFSKSILFTVDEISWLFNPVGGYKLQELSTESLRFEVSADCSVATDLKTMSSICQGKIKPISAALSGKLKLDGDRASFKIIRSLLKDALITPDDGSSSLPLFVHILGIVSGLNTVTSSRVPIAQPDVSEASEETLNDGVVRYLIEVHDRVTEEVWHVTHRYSDFVRLRNQLVELGFNSSTLPSLSAKNSLFHSYDVIINDRIKKLSEFINKSIRIVGTENFTLNSFLLNDHRGALLSSKLRVALQNKNRKKNLETIVFDALATPIRWKFSNFIHSRFLVEELAKIRRKVNEIPLNISESKEITKTLINMGKKGINVFLFFLVFAVVVFYSSRQGIVESDVEDRFNFLDVVLKNLFLMALVLPFTRKICLSYFIGFIFMINAIILSLYNFNLNFKSAVLLEGSGTNFDYSQLEPIIRGLVNSLKSGFLNCVTASFNHSMLILSNITNSFLARHEFNVFSLTIVFLLLSFFLLLYIKKHRRALHICIIGFGLMFFYTGLKVFCFVFRLSEGDKDLLYEKMDNFIAPILVPQIAQLRSVFVKFAQYFGARADWISLRWAKELKQLQDSCPPSDPEYVKKTLETQFQEIIDKYGPFDLNGEEKSSALETVFESFDWHPLASASIAQVHTGTVKASLLQELENKLSAETDDEDNMSYSGRQSFTSSENENEEIFSNDPLGPTMAAVGTEDMAPKNFSTAAAMRAGHRTVPEFSLVDRDTTETSMLPNSLFVGLESSNSSLGGTRLKPNKQPATNAGIVPVVIKVQHENIHEIMVGDMYVLMLLVRFAALLDKRWKAMIVLLQSWNTALMQELDFFHEAGNLREASRAMEFSGLSAVVPFPLQQLSSKKVLVMTRLYGYKVTDKLALTLFGVDRAALLRRIAHCCAWQLLVAGIFNADPHPGNIMFCLGMDNIPEFRRNERKSNSEKKNNPNSAAVKERKSESSLGNNRPNMDKNNKKMRKSDISMDEKKPQNESKKEFNKREKTELGIIPGLLDFGMTVRLRPDRRRAYCALILALFEGDLSTAARVLQEVGYRTSQSDRAPERDAEFFEYLFRDAKPRGISQQQRKEFMEYRKKQKQNDNNPNQNNPVNPTENEKKENGRNIEDIPEDFLFLTRVMGLLRGLSAELDCSCPLLYIFALHAKVGLNI